MQGDPLPARLAPLPIPRPVWLILGLALALRIGLMLDSHFTYEDFFITLRYARHLAQGHGFVYNLGERTLGTTTPLYALLLASAFKLGLPAISLGKGANLAADSALCLVLYRLLTRLNREKAGIAAAFLVAVSALHLRVAISGMETGLVTLGIAFAWMLFVERREILLWSVLALLFLLRWDSLLFTAVMLLSACVRDRRIPLRGLMLFALLTLPWLLFATRYFGSPIPVTLAAKTAVYGWRYQHRILPELLPLLRRFLGTPAALAVSLLALAGLMDVMRKRLSAFAPLLLWFTLYWVAFLLSRNLLFEWYLLPPLPVIEALAGLGAAMLMARIPLSWPRPLRLGPVIVLAACYGISQTSVALVACRETQQIEDHLRIPLGLWLKRQVAPSERVMLEPIGYIGYYSERRILDSVGLVTPSVLSCWRLDDPAPLLCILRRYRPEWCVFRPGELQHIQEAAQAAGYPWNREYRLIKTFSYTPRPDRSLIIFHVFRRVYQTTVKGGPARCGS